MLQGQIAIATPTQVWYLSMKKGPFLTNTSTANAMYMFGSIRWFQPILQTNESRNQMLHYSSIGVVKHETIRYPLTGVSITCGFTSNNHWMPLTYVGSSCKIIHLNDFTGIWSVNTVDGSLKSGDHQLRLVVYPMIYKVLAPSQVGFLAGFQPSTVVHGVTPVSPNPGCLPEKSRTFFGDVTGSVFWCYTILSSLNFGGVVGGRVLRINEWKKRWNFWLWHMSGQSRKGTPMLNYLTFFGRVVRCVDINDQLHSDGQVIIKSVGDECQSFIILEVHSVQWMIAWGYTKQGYTKHIPKWALLLSFTTNTNQPTKLNVHWHDAPMLRMFFHLPRWNGRSP